MAATLAEIIVPVCVSLGGAVVAGYASYLVGRGTRSHEWRLALIRERLLERRQLYARFMAEADRNMLLIVAGGAKSIDNVMPLFAMLAEISLLSSDAVQESAKALCDCALHANRRDGDGKSEGDHFGTKTAFLKAARSEITQLEADAYKRPRQGR